MKAFLLATTAMIWASTAHAATPVPPTPATPFNCNVSGIVDGQPPAAALAGYNTLTFDPNVTLGQNWVKDTQDGTTANATQNSGGSVTVAGGGDTWNGQLETYLNGRGEAFGGGFYVQATVVVPGLPQAFRRGPAAIPVTSGPRSGQTQSMAQSKPTSWR
jgi:hypothetical protein